VARQYGPRDVSFVPRPFSITHINPTHCNWTAVGIPDLDALPIVDPRGLMTPFWDGWSLDVWIRDEDGRWLLAARAADATQVLDLADGVAVVTQIRDRGLESIVRVAVRESRAPELVMSLEGLSVARLGWLIAALRPYNPEGVSFVHAIRLERAPSVWRIERRHEVRLDPLPDAHRVSDWKAGDVFHRLDGTADGRGRDGVHCRAMQWRSVNTLPA